MPEWSKGNAWKAFARVNEPQVRILSSPYLQQIGIYFQVVVNILSRDEKQGTATTEQSVVVAVNPVLSVCRMASKSISKTKMKDVKFKHGESGRTVLKKGNKVYKPVSNNYKFSHSVLTFLEEKGFKYSPRVFGVDKKDREIISYIDGEPIVFDPIPLKISIKAMQILREFHDILSEFTEEETICHLDYAPWNILIKDNSIVGIIDFDGIYAGNRITDITYAIWTFLNLGCDNLIIPDDLQIKNLMTMLKAYGTDINYQDFISVLLSEQQRVLTMRLKAMKCANSLKDQQYQKTKVKIIRESINWVIRHKEEINMLITNL